MLHTPDFQKEIAELIVESLNLEIEANTIAPDTPLFYEGLGLDSIDALELSLAISQRYGMTLSSDDPDNETIFASLASLAETIHQRKTT